MKITIEFVRHIYVETKNGYTRKVRTARCVTEETQSTRLPWPWMPRVKGCGLAVDRAHVALENSQRRVNGLDDTKLAIRASAQQCTWYADNHSELKSTGNLRAGQNSTTTRGRWTDTYGSEKICSNRRYVQYLIRQQSKHQEGQHV